MLKRIKVRGYKSLVDVEVSLKPLTVLFGPNAAGKSNFLDALQLLSKLATSPTLKDAFSPPYRGAPLESFSFDRDGVKGSRSKTQISFTIEADVELSESVVKAVNRQIREMKQTKAPDDMREEGPEESSYVRERNLRYSLEVVISPDSGILQVANESLTPLTPEGKPSGRRKPFLDLVKDRLHLRMEGQAHPIYYDRYLDHSVISKPHYPPHYPHLVAMRQELASWFFFYFEPRERMRAPNPVKEVRHIGLMGEELAAFLNTLNKLEPKQFRAVEKSLHMIVPYVTGIEVGVNDLGEVELRLKEGDTPIPARVVSEGTLRVLGLLAISGARELPALIGFEEPENGIHPRRIRLVADLLKNQAAGGDTQIIVTTHSVTLADQIPTESLYVCKRTGRSTSISSFNSWGPLFNRTGDIETTLNSEESLPVSERILRGDFDA
jgi:predicted ATPase